ncbi:macro domain-containing protein [Streptomyces sp. NPDC005794]|uniref:macro domain-containing protein n=1 Tax=Streptomyces sp. NPDC005794 TaxID=3364733 RepID=UPI0036C7D95B
MPDLPTHQSLVRELRDIRRPGLPRLRHCAREALREAAVAVGTSTGEGDELQGIERMLAAAVQHLAGGGPLRDEPACDPLARAAAHTFGLFPDRRGTAAADRRKAAAAVYGVSTERFRRSHEQEIMAELASSVLMLVREAGPAVRTGGAHGGQHRPPFPLSGRMLAGPPPTGPVPAHVTNRITVRVCPIELVRDADILVSSENTYLEMSKIFRPTVSGALRRAAAVRNGSGEIVDDVLQRELSTWLRGHGRTGLPVRPGTVVATSPGALASHGVRRVYHAAISSPVEDGDRYHIAPASLAEAVRATFTLARAERETLSIPLSTVCFPLLGAGHGGLPAETAARWLLWALRQELSEDSTWRVRLVAQQQGGADALKAANSTP